jgi:chemotaxis signal transduction protein
VLIEDDGTSTAIQVDEVAGTHRYSQTELRPVPDTLPGAEERSIEAILLAGTRTVGVLGARALMNHLARCLA